MTLVSTFTLGQAPHRMTVVLAAGADFVASLYRDDGQPWPAGEGVGCSLKLTEEIAWFGPASGAAINFEVDSEEVDAAIAETPKTAKLYYEDGQGLRLLWAMGPVVLR